jgi:hypothetical protein
MLHKLKEVPELAPSPAATTPTPTTKIYPAAHNAAAFAFYITFEMAWEIYDKGIY